MFCFWGPAPGGGGYSLLLVSQNMKEHNIKETQFNYLEHKAPSQFWELILNMVPSQVQMTLSLVLLPNFTELQNNEYTYT